MKILSFLKNKELPWVPEAFPKPWDPARPAIYACLLASARGESLPDDEVVNADGGLRWMSGALDHLVAGGEGRSAQDAASEVYAALKGFIKRPTEAGLKTLYGAIVSRSALEYVDALTDFVATGIDFARLHGLMRWFCCQAPDREAVKVAIALLGLRGSADDTVLFRTLGGHEEFTLFANVALLNSVADPEQEIWDMARRLDGWGKIDAIERLAGTANPEIKAWLLRYGCANSVMNEYLAYTCAVSGDLLSALKAAPADDDLLSGAADIIEALFVGGPARDMFDYPDGAEVVAVFVAQTDRETLGLSLCATLVRIARILVNDHDRWQSQPGWTDEVRLGTAEKAIDILSCHDLAARAVPDLMVTDHRRFYDAITLAEYLGIDVWQVYFDRQLAGIESWYFLMQTDDTARIDRVLDLAREQLDLAAMASGPTLEITGFGEAFAMHSALDFIVQDLRRFPGKGWAFVAASLKSPMIRNRNMALKALEEWGRGAWPADAENAIRAALACEPDEKVRASIAQLLEGQNKDETCEDDC